MNTYVHIPSDWAAKQRRQPRTLRSLVKPSDTEFLELLTLMLRVVPDDRITAAKALKHTFFS